MAAGVGVVIVRSGMVVRVVAAAVRGLVIVVMPAAFGRVVVVVRVIQRQHATAEPGDHAEHQEPCKQATHDDQRTRIPSPGKRILPPPLALGTSSLELHYPLMPVAEPAKELRFTRAGQAAGFWIAAAVCLMAGLVFFLLTPHRAENPELPHPAWGLVPLALAAGLIRLAWRCTKHAYLLLSPVGVEVFPLVRPEAGMQVIPWQQIHSAEIDQRRLTLHFTAEKSAGIHLSLSPIAKDRRELLARAIRGRFPSDPPSSISHPPSP